jgi:hypothetical protein
LGHSISSHKSPFERVCTGSRCVRNAGTYVTGFRAWCLICFVLVSSQFTLPSSASFAGTMLRYITLLPFHALQGHLIRYGIGHMEIRHSWRTHELYYTTLCFHTPPKPFHIRSPGRTLLMRKLPAAPDTTQWGFLATPLGADLHCYYSVLLPHLVLA